MDSRILNAEIEGVPILSPFETARQREGLFDESDFNEVAQEEDQEESPIDVNIFGDKVTVREDGSKMIENDEGEVTIID